MWYASPFSVPFLTFWRTYRQSFSILLWVQIWLTRSSNIVLFFRTRAPIEPVSFVSAICADAMETRKQKTRFARRLTPMTMVGKATEAGLESVADIVLPPVFHGDENQGKTVSAENVILVNLGGVRVISNADRVSSQSDQTFAIKARS